MKINSSFTKTCFIFFLFVRTAYKNCYLKTRNNIFNTKVTSIGFKLLLSPSSPFPHPAAC